ncbi:MAG: zinc ribbon domain-containing protein, partial [Spirochaetaceae bacterium]|nr:zinc ribbon domain-containing protein [Spirochaetaceae bacterium]
MPMCEKCGAHLEDGLKYCDKCGSELSTQNTTETMLPDIENINSNEEKDKGFSLMEKINLGLSYLPPALTKQGDRTSLMIGLGSLGVVSVLYIICFFSFMSEMCLPVSMGVFNSYLGGLGNIASGASPLWIVFYFVFNLSPVFLAVYAFLKKNFRFYAIFASLSIFFITFLSFVFWGLCEPDVFIEAIDSYQGAGSLAWYVFVDCLSEVWYLKMLLSLVAAMGLGV